MIADSVGPLHGPRRNINAEEFVPNPFLSSFADGADAKSFMQATHDAMPRPTSSDPPAGAEVGLGLDRLSIRTIVSPLFSPSMDLFIP